jgi:hypothetical protein
VLGANRHTALEATTAQENCELSDTGLLALKFTTTDAPRSTRSELPEFRAQAQSQFVAYRFKKGPDQECSAAFKSLFACEELIQEGRGENPLEANHHTAQNTSGMEGAT